MSGSDDKSPSLEELQRWLHQPADLPLHLRQLLLAVANEDEEIRAWSADCLQAIERIDDQQADIAVNLIDHDCDYVVHWVCQVLAKSVGVARFQPQLTAVLKNHSNLGVRQAAAATLRCVEPLAPATRQALQQAAADDDPRLRRLSQQALDRQ